MGWLHSSSHCLWRRLSQQFFFFWHKKSIFGRVNKIPSNNSMLIISLVIIFYKNITCFSLVFGNHTKGLTLSVCMLCCTRIVSITSTLSLCPMSCRAATGRLDKVSKELEEEVGRSHCNTWPLKAPMYLEPNLNGHVECSDFHRVQRIHCDAWVVQVMAPGVSHRVLVVPAWAGTLMRYAYHQPV